MTQASSLASKFGHIAWRSAIILLIAVTIVVAVAGLVCKVERLHIMGVASGSMSPVLQVGDAVVVRPVGLSQLGHGDVISYRSPAGVVISHRIESVNTKTKTVVTRGDNLKTVDPLINQGQIIGRAVYVLPGFGKLLNVLRKPTTIISLIYIPAAAMVISESSRLVRRLNAPIYSVRQTRF